MVTFLFSYMFWDHYMTNVYLKVRHYVCSLCTGIDTAALKYLARYSVLNSIFDLIIQPQFSYLLLLDWFSFVCFFGTCVAVPHVHLACWLHINEMKLESYWLFKEIILKFSHILVILRGYILLVNFQLSPLL